MGCIVGYSPDRSSVVLAKVVRLCIFFARVNQVLRVCGQERKRRDYLCRQRYRNRGQAEGDQTPSSLDKNREISPRRSGSILHAGNHAPVEEEVVSEGADEHGYPPPRTAIARRVNGEASMEVLGHEIDESEVVAEDAMMHNHPRVYQTAREAMEGEGTTGRSSPDLLDDAVADAPIESVSDLIV